MSYLRGEWDIPLYLTAKEYHNVAAFVSYFVFFCMCVCVFLPFAALSLGLMHLRQHRWHRWHQHRHRHRHQRKMHAIWQISSCVALDTRQGNRIVASDTRIEPDTWSVGQGHATCSSALGACPSSHHASPHLVSSRTASPAVSETQLFSTRRWRWAFWHKVHRFIVFDFFDPFVSRALESRVTHKAPQLSINLWSDGVLYIAMSFVAFKRNEKRTEHHHACHDVG